ncbi:hypothetical protein N7462_002121 [Penicillium macrosclerotiorum]|uniref:uncharacterized protein n=1 Tax=Penicillium macrosclerotiorum TaxID=303699 RepID=UPI00254727D3|nr:uncharacterized protein N7462_002121 [Penicillium macrosclerotiorum]KAJ5692698.1 hypothetical protein N7462_002121 [Penicillium macrosclerotiorum]
MAVSASWVEKAHHRKEPHPFILATFMTKYASYGNAHVERSSKARHDVSECFEEGLLARHCVTHFTAHICLQQGPV